jgi:hypothetical protein
VDRFTHHPLARSDAKGGAANLEGMTTMQNWREVVDEAVEAPMAAASNGGRVSAEVLGRATLARRVSDAHERALDEARELRDEVQRLISTLERDGIGAATSGNSFASKARTVSGALIRLQESREIFGAFVGYSRAERDAAARHAAPRLPAAEPSSGDDVEPEDEDEGNEIED